MHFVHYFVMCLSHITPLTFAYNIFFPLAITISIWLNVCNLKNSILHMRQQINRFKRNNLISMNCDRRSSFMKKIIVLFDMLIYSYFNEINSSHTNSKKKTKKCTFEWETMVLLIDVTGPWLLYHNWFLSVWYFIHFDEINIYF